MKPGSSLAGYSGAPLVRKLGIKKKMAVGLIHVPFGFEKKLGSLPEGVTFCQITDQYPDLILWFAQSLDETKSMMAGILPKIPKDGIWILWPKKSSGISTDLDQNTVRRLGLSNGLVDFKVCAFDETWSALKFVKRAI